MADAGIFRLFNRTRACVLCESLQLVDMSENDLRQLLADMATKPGLGLWIRPCIGAPGVEDAAPFDLVGIDQNLRVVEQHEAFQPGSFVLFKPQTTSAILLAVHAVASTGTQPGDDLEIAAPDAKPVPRPAVPREIATSDVEEPPALLDLPRAPDVLAADTDEFPVERSKATFGMRMMHRLVPDKRKAKRQPMPNLVAFRRATDRLCTYAVEDISKSGIYLVTNERPLPGTIFILTLQKSGSLRSEVDGSLNVYVRVVRWGPDGLGLEFVTQETVEKKDEVQHLNGGSTIEQLHKFVASVKPEEA